jgi:hypothetical protein
MSRSAWLIASAALFSIACSGSNANDQESNPPVEPDDTRDSEGGAQPGTFVSDGADGLRLEMYEGSSYRCNNTCSAVCSDCLFEACMATASDTSLCVRSRDACNTSCGLCAEGGSAIACYKPCWKGERSCYENLAIDAPDDITRPDVTMPEVTPEPSSDEQATSEQSTPSSSSSGNSSRPAN